LRLESNKKLLTKYYIEGFSSFVKGKRSVFLQYYTGIDFTVEAA
jgi:hypothetical protein